MTMPGVGKWTITAVAAGVVAAGVLAATGRVDLSVPTRSGGAAAPVHALSPGEKVPTQRQAAGIAPTPHRLKVTSDPPGAQLRITREDGSSKVTRTPFSGTVTGGHLRLTLVRPGYNPLTERLDLDRDRALHRWLDPAGLLHHKIGVLDTG